MCIVAFGMSSPCICRMNQQVVKTRVVSRHELFERHFTHFTRVLIRVKPWPYGDDDKINHRIKKNDTLTSVHCVARASTCVQVYVYAKKWSILTYFFLNLTVLLYFT